MTMSTIYVSIADGEVKGIAESTEVTAALYDLRWCFGEVYACRVSDNAAFEIRHAFVNPKFKGTTPLVLLKRYSQSMQKCADVT